MKRSIGGAIVPLLSVATAAVLPPRPAFASENDAAIARAVPAPPFVERAPDQEPPSWKWRSFNTMDYLITGVGAGTTLAAAIITPRRSHGLDGGILFDDWARRTFRRDDLEARYTFRDASDVGLSLAVTWPFFADSLVAAWWYRGSRDVAQELALIDLQTLAVSGAIQGVTNLLASRERPYGQDCGGDQLPGDSLDCTGSVRYRSFFSGHSAFSFTGAALICTHHFNNELLGPPWDALSCAGGYLVAATTASFRVASDVHYASDVLTGALLGTLVGYGVPLLHYMTPASQTATQVWLVPAAGGLGAIGVF